jgi:hypothetical protein
MHARRLDNTISCCWVSCTRRNTVTHLTLSLLRLVRNRELPDSPDASAGYWSDATIIRSVQEHFFALEPLTPDADVTRPVLTSFSALDTPVTKTGHAPRCTTNQTLGPASGAPKAGVPCTKNSEEHFWKFTSFANVLTPPSVYHHVHVC